DHVVALLLGLHRVGQMRDAHDGLAERRGNRAAAAALRIDLHVGVELLLVVECLVLVPAERVVDGENPRERGARRAGVDGLVLAFVGGMKQTVPRRRWLEAFFAEQLGGRHEHQRVLGHGRVVPFAILQLDGEPIPRRRAIRLEDAGLLGRREPVAGCAPDHIGARIVLLRRRARHELARRQSDEVDLDPGFGGISPEDRLRQRLRPRRVDVDRFGRRLAGEPDDDKQRHAHRHAPIAHRPLPVPSAGRDTLHDRPHGGMLGAKPEEATMAKIKHIAISSQDPDATAKSYVHVFGIKQVGRIDNPNTTGYYLTDGDINLAILKFKNDKVAGVERGKGWSGIHHFGFQEDDLDDTTERLAAANAPRRDDINEALGAAGHHDAPAKPYGNVEVKYTGPDGVTGDVSETGWVGTESFRPG